MIAVIGLSIPTAVAQTEFLEIVQGPGYAQEVYVDCSTGQTTTVSVDSWDIAFTGGTSAGIWINEGSSSEGSPLALFALEGNHAFSDTLTPAQAGMRLYNDKNGRGAFGRVASADNPFDLGWGVYDPISHSVSEGPTYLIQNRDSSWLKFRVDNLSSGQFVFEYAGLDNSGYQRDSVDTRGADDRVMVHYSLRDRAPVAAIPADWDVVFTRYVTPLSDGQGNILDYMVTGVLQAPGVAAAEVVTLDPENRNFDASSDSLQTALDVIGYDWKSFDLQTFTWAIPDTVVYFIQDREGQLWKWQFIDFEGSSTGTSVLAQSEADLVSSTGSVQFSPDFSVRAFPNPVVDQLQVRLEQEVEAATELQWSLTDLQGRVLKNGRRNGWDAETWVVPVRDLPAGAYVLQVQHGRFVATQTITKR